MGFRVTVLTLEALMKCQDILLDVLNELRLVFGDGTSNFRSDEKWVELGEDAEHLAGGLSSTKTVSKPSDDGVLNTRSTLVVLLLCLFEKARAFR